MAHNFLQNFVYTENVTTKFQAWHKLSVKQFLTFWIRQIDFTSWWFDEKFKDNHSVHLNIKFQDDLTKKMSLVVTAYCVKHLEDDGFKLVCRWKKCECLFKVQKHVHLRIKFQEDLTKKMSLVVTAKCVKHLEFVNQVSRRFDEKNVIGGDFLLRAWNSWKTTVWRKKMWDSVQSSKAKTE